MKTILTKITLLISLSPFLLVSLSAQTYQITQPVAGGPVMVKYYDGATVHKQVITDLDATPVARIKTEDKTIDFDLSVFRDGYGTEGNYPKSEIISWLEPGLPVEGDLPSDGAFTKDGSMFAIIYQNSDNIIFYDAETYEIVATVQLVRQPVDLCMGDDHVYIACHDGKGVCVVSLEDFSISNYIPVDGTPCQVEVSPTEDTAYIACDSWRDGWMTAVDLSDNNQVIYSTHDPYFHHYGYIGGMGRISYNFTTFKLSPKGDQFICGDTAHTMPTIFNAYSGHPLKTFTIGGWRGAGYSPTGDLLYIYSSDDDTVKMLRVNTADLSVIDSIYSTQECWLGITSYTDLAISSDGSEVLINDNHNERYCLFDFDTYSCQTFSAWMLIEDSPTYTASDGHTAAVANWYKVEFIDIESGTLYNTWPGWTLSKFPLCLSPSENRLVVGNAPAGGSELLFAVNFTDLNNIILDSNLLCGEAPEADMPFSAMISEDGQKVISANVSTSNISVINLEDNSLDTIFVFSGIGRIKAIPRTDYALLYGRSLGSCFIMSMTDYSVVAEILMGGIEEAYISSDGTAGYLFEYQASDMVRITRIHIDGPSSAIEQMVITDGCHSLVHYINAEVDLYTTAALSPDDQYLLIGYDDDTRGPVVNVISTETLDILVSVPVVEYCIYDYAFTDDSKRAVAAGYNAMVPVIYLDGANSFVENYIPITNHSYSAAYNPSDGYFYVLDQINTIFKADPLTGEVVETLNTFDEYNWKIETDLRGNMMVLTNSFIIYNGEAYATPGHTTMLQYEPQHDLFLIPMPGPDLIGVFDPELVGIQQFKPGKSNEISIFPNPATDQIVITAQEEILWVKISDMKGKEVFSGDYKAKNIKLSTAGMKPGMFIVDVKTMSGNFAGKMVIR